MNFFSIWAILATAISRFAFVGCAPTPVELVETSNLERRTASITSVNGRLFNIDYKTQYFTGQNPRGALRSCAYKIQTGYKVTRVWGFGTTNNPSATSDVYYQILNSTGQYINYNTNNGIARLDYAVSAAEKYGIKIILPLLNNYDALGGINTYTNVYGGTHQGFYTNAAAQTAYKNYIKFIVSRYKTSTAIFSWELCNEPRCSGCDSSVITNWASQTSAYIKSLDPNHLVSLGDEGWLTSTSSYLPNSDGSYAYSGYEGVDFEKNLAISTIDYGTFHLYADQWGYNYTWGSTWITQHNQIGKKLCKPVVLQEYAVPDGQNRIAIEGPWQDTVMSKTSIAGDLMWQFGTKFPSGANPYDNYAMYYNTSDYQTLGNQHAKVVATRTAVATL
ncbi:MAG: hypothetical protein LQ338_002450 [Usnochroma carphineum]|nr:MAG: hypothetical protein LQ338_002450 [Usnochroma carphineum]